MPIDDKSMVIHNGIKLSDFQSNLTPNLKLKSKFNALSDKLLTPEGQADKKKIIFDCQNFTAREFIELRRSALRVI